MLLGKKRKLGRMIHEISLGEKLSMTEKIEDKDLLLYLGLTDDANPLYIQHDYASQTPYRKPVVPTIMLTGMLTSAVSKYLPGPGSHVVGQQLSFIKPVYHYASVTFAFEVVDVDYTNHQVQIDVKAIDEEQDVVVVGHILVAPPHKLRDMDGSALDNF